MYTTHKSDRARWLFEVRWNGGRCYARCLTELDATAIALALNTLAEMQARGTKALTPDEVGALCAAIEAGKRRPIGEMEG